MILEQLKLKTRKQHSRLHQHALLRGITQSGYSLARYIQLLKAYYEIYSAIESVLLQRQSQFNSILITKLAISCRGYKPI